MTTLRIEGNNGGDYLEISAAGDNLVSLEIGHCCVVTIRHVVPVEFITAVLTRYVLEHKTVQGAIIALPWAKEFTYQLAGQVRQTNRRTYMDWKLENDIIDIPSVSEVSDSESQSLEIIHERDAYRAALLAIREHITPATAYPETVAWVQATVDGVVKE